MMDDVGQRAVTSKLITEGAGAAPGVLICVRDCTVREGKSILRFSFFLPSYLMGAFVTKIKNSTF